VFTLFLLFPFVHHRMRQFQQNNISYGTTRLSTTVPVGEFYVAHVLGAFAFGVFVFGAAIVMAFVIAAAAFTANDPAVVVGGERPEEPPIAAVVVFLAIYGVGLLLSRAIVLSRLQNAVWSSSRLGPHGFHCNLGVLRVFGITLTNVIAAIATLGLFLPFAQVRLTRYMASRFTLYPGGSLDAIAGAPADDASALGDEAAEMFDVDIGF
jgi:uncharacterized membrane protein YjgN (DUF898 family)